MSHRNPRKTSAPGGEPAGGPPAAAPAARFASFEESLSELERIVDELEEGALPLEESLSRFERGIQLSRHLEQQLREAEARVQRLVGGTADSPLLEPMAEAGGEEANERGAAPPGPSDDEEDDGDDRLLF